MDARFFVKLEKNEVISIYENNTFERCKLTYKGDKKSVSVAVKLKLISLTPQEGGQVFGRLYIIPDSIHELQGRECAFSFRIGTRVLFFKGTIEIDKRGFYVEVGYGMFELKRRRHDRFEFPKDIKYSCLIISPSNKNIRLESEILNISESGIRLLAKSDLAFIQKDNSIIISLQVGKRASFFIGGKIKHVVRKKKTQPEIGIEFVEMNDGKKDKVLNICEDISRLSIKTKRGILVPV